MYSLNYIHYIILSISIGKTDSREFCNLDDTFANLKYYKIRTCHKSTLPIIAWFKTSTQNDCMYFARQRRALAFNFSPEEASTYRNFSQNCQVLGCPEKEKSITLIPDVAFDYYSAYKHMNMTENATCIISTGLFSLVEEKQNYTKSIEKCESVDAYLADVLSELRTNHLSQYVNDTLPGWYKVAYIGLNDIKKEGTFKTVNGSRLSCFRYRAWGPGHPRSKQKNEDCVVLDTEGTWRVVTCNTKLPALCEFRLTKSWNETDRHNNCVSDKDCNSKHMDIQLHNNQTRLDKCSMVHDGQKNSKV